MKNRRLSVSHSSAEGAGHEILSDSELEKYARENLVVSYQYETLKRFLEGFRVK